MSRSTLSLSSTRRRVVNSLAIVSFTLGVVPSAQSSSAGSAGTHAGHYIDRAFGFSFSKPRFAGTDEAGASAVAVSLAGASKGSLAPSVNVVVENRETTLEAYAERQRAELEAIGWELLEQTPSQIGAKPALRTHARGALHGQEIEFVAVAGMRDGKRMLVLTCTAASAQFPLYAAEFERVITSFSMEP